MFFLLWNLVSAEKWKEWERENGCDCFFILLLSCCEFCCNCIRWLFYWFTISTSMYLTSNIKLYTWHAYHNKHTNACTQRQNELKTLVFRAEDIIIKRRVRAHMSVCICIVLFMVYCIHLKLLPLENGKRDKNKTKHTWTKNLQSSFRNIKVIIQNTLLHRILGIILLSDIVLAKRSTIKKI